MATTSNSIREPLASLFYDVRYRVSRNLHAVTRNRMLSGLALGYTPQGAPDFGLERARFAAAGERYAVLLHATARASKEWPEDNWIALGEALAPRGLDLVLPWGNDAERVRSERIAARLARARVPRAGAARSGRAPDRRRAIRGRRRYRADASRRRARRAAGRDLRRQQAGLTGPVGSGPIAVLGAEGAPPSVEEVREAVEKVAP